MTEDLSAVLELHTASGAQKAPNHGNLPGTHRNAKQVSLYSFVVFLAISALMAIACVLSGRFGEFEIKVILTTSAISVASICALCCSAYSAQTESSMPGLGGMIVAGTSAGMLILGVWTEMDSEGYWKATAILCIFAIASAHSLALLAVRLRPLHRWLQVGSTINILLLAAAISALILFEVVNDSASKPIAVLAILVALETLVIPILGRLAKAGDGRTIETLFLARREDGNYEDRQGRLYEVNNIGEP